MNLSKSHRKNRVPNMLNGATERPHVLRRAGSACYTPATVAPWRIRNHGLIRGPTAGTAKPVRGHKRSRYMHPDYRQHQVYTIEAETTATRQVAEW